MSNKIRNKKQAEAARAIATRRIGREKQEAYLATVPVLGTPDAEAAWANFWSEARNFPIPMHSSEQMAKEMYMWGWMRRGSE